MDEFLCDPRHLFLGVVVKTVGSNTRICRAAGSRHSEDLLAICA